MKLTKLIIFVLAAVLLLVQWNGAACAVSAAGIDADANAALHKLYETQPVAKMLGEKSRWHLDISQHSQGGLCNRSSVLQGSS